MAVFQDKLITLPHERYVEYLRLIYTEMAAFVPEHADIIEIGARHDRGVVSKEIIPHKSFVSVDRDPGRGDEHYDVLLQETPLVDVILSTCVLHHTKEEDIPRLLSHLNAPILMFSGPNAEIIPELFGDHEWHIDIVKLDGWLAYLGYDVICKPIGMSGPFSELLVIAR